MSTQSQTETAERLPEKTAMIRENEKGTYIIPPIIQSRMTGVVRVFITSDKRCCAVYEDGSKEFARLEQPSRDNFFALVGQIQRAARA